jgi:malate synthase
MGGMAAQIPIKNDPEANASALAKVRADKEREASDGHDGTWVAHPGLVPLALEVFNRYMPGPNQLSRLREDVKVGAADLLQAPAGTITEAGLANNVSVGLQYLAAWLGGLGCVPINNLMEDAATAEISRAQLWQWVHHPTGVLEDGRHVTLDLVRERIRLELGALKARAEEGDPAAGHYELAARLLDRLTAEPRFTAFLTLVAYREID